MVIAKHQSVVRYIENEIRLYQQGKKTFIAHQCQIAKDLGLSGSTVHRAVTKMDPAIFKIYKETPKSLAGINCRIKNEKKRRIFPPHPALIYAREEITKFQKDKNGHISTYDEIRKIMTPWITRERVRQILGKGLTPAEKDIRASYRRESRLKLAKIDREAIKLFFHQEIASFWQGELDRFALAKEIEVRFGANYFAISKVLDSDLKKERSLLIRMQSTHTLTKFRNMIQIIKQELEVFDINPDFKVSSNKELSAKIGASGNNISGWTKKFLPKELYAKRNKILRAQRGALYTQRDQSRRLPANINQMITEFLAELLARFDNKEIKSLLTQKQLADHFGYSLWPINNFFYSRNAKLTLDMIRVRDRYLKVCRKLHINEARERMLRRHQLAKSSQ